MADVILGQQSTEANFTDSPIATPGYRLAIPQASAPIVDPNNSGFYYRNISFQVPSEGGRNLRSAASYDATQADLGLLIELTNTGATDLILPNPGTVVTFFKCAMVCAGATNVSVAGGATIDGVASIDFDAGESCWFYSNGINYRMAGRGGPGITLPIAESDVTGLVSDLATIGTVITALAAEIAPAAAGITIDGGASTPATGSKGYLQVPFNATITGWSLVADASGSAQITVKKSTYSGFPTTTSIVASAQPKLITQQKNTSTTLTGWTTSITAGDILEFVLDSVTTCKRLTLELQLARS